jgi:glutamate formiminotransferase / formiminotetrahydrofolate cyclodeaminase
MKKIVECVPNFSEGQDQQVIEAIAAAIHGTSGCSLLDVDPGRSTHRTVYTFVGDPRAIVEGALAAARVARKLIDMRKHRGEHPRMGALDVCPFVPVSGVSMAECVAIAEEFGRRLAKELQVPVYLYEEAARQEYRRRLADIRDGEYEGLAEKITDGRWLPDFGPAAFVPEWGATVTGARMFLIAYNVNVLGTSNQAHRIALNLRETGRGDGQPGRLPAVQGMGWYVKEYQMAQVTVNIMDYRTTPIHVLYEEVKKEAEALGVGVAGSEIVGLVPREALLAAADYYIRRENIFIHREDQKIRLATERLGLNAIAPFIAQKRVIEYLVAEPPNEPLASLSVRGFIEEVAARSSAPGGGSASAMMAAVGAALGAMVAQLTYGVRKFEDVGEQMQQALPVLDGLCQQLIPMIDADTSAFNEYMLALKLPKNTAEEKSGRRLAMQAGLKTAVVVPLTTMRLGDSVWDSLAIVARYGNPASASDVQVGARALETGIWGAWQNVLINLRNIDDHEYIEAIRSEADVLATRAACRCQEILAIIDQRISRRES